MSQPEVTVSEGKLQGGSCKTSEGFQYDYFLGIPYAKPPVGNLRFRDPQPPESWDGVRDAVVQRDMNPQYDFYTRKVVGDEDSLFLNVYTPSSTSATSKLPVILYIHGGGFYVGNGNFERFRPDYLVQKGVVFVSINYRLGPFGFLCLHTSEVPGNAGLKDQAFALRWVQKNIEAFGGDPQNVTLMGSSAGGVCVNFHLMSPMSRGLFSKAIMQSGTCLSAWGIQEEPERNIFDLVKKMGLDTSNKDEALNFLRSVSAEDLVEATRIEFTYRMHTVFTSVIERSYSVCESFIHESPVELMNSGNYSIVPCIQGICSHEGVRFISGDTLKTITDEIRPIDVDELKVLLKRNHNPNITTEEVEEFYKFYFGDTKKLMNGFINLISDIFFVKYAFESVKLLRKHNESVFFYLLSYRGSLNTPLHALMDPNVGCGHGDENYYLFKREKDTHQLTESDAIVRDRLTRMWTNFAKFGNPTPQIDETIDTIWKPTSEHGFDCLDINQNTTMIRDPLKERMNCWENSCIDKRSWMPCENLDRKTKKLPCPCPICPKKKKVMRYCQPPIPTSYAPRYKYQKMGTFEDSTIYNLSYKIQDGDLRRKPIIQTQNLLLSSAKMVGDTIHRLSYLPNSAKAMKPILPQHNDLGGRGPMQDLTTHKHDYVPKPFNFTNAIKPNVNLQLSDKAIEDDTVHNLSYQAPGRVDRARSYAPHLFYNPPSQKMESSTVQKLSYCPNPVLEKTLPWLPKSSQGKFLGTFDGSTIYNNSYLPPGWECEDSNKSNCCNTTDYDCTCGNESNISVMSETFPKAAC